MENPYCSEEEAAHYTCLRTRSPMAVDGRLDEEAWKLAVKSPRFVDVVSGGRGIYDTRAAVLWDQEARTSVSGSKNHALKHLTNEMR
jgi:hypothetical protein